MLLPIEHGLISEIDAALKQEALAQTFSPQIILQKLKPIGFGPCLFYDAAPNPVSGDYQIILSAVEGEEAQRNHIGARVEYKSTAIGLQRGNHRPIVQRPNDDNQPRGSIELAKKLGTFDLNRVHTPLYYQDMLIGAFTCAWKGDDNLLTQEHTLVQIKV
jgi:hypothetical protein